MDPYAPYWEVLELAPTGDLDALKRAYHEQALTWHPDRFPYDEGLRRRCEERMRLVNAAYETLLEALESGAVVPEEPRAPPPEPPWPRAVKRPAAAPREEASSDVAHWRPRSAAEEEAELRALQAPPAWSEPRWVAVALSVTGMTLVALFLLPFQTWAPYWKAMRLLTSPALGFSAAAAFARKDLDLGLGWALLAVALNPVFPIAMPLEDWRVFNAVAPVLLAGMYVLMSRREEKG